MKGAAASNVRGGASAILALLISFSAPAASAQGARVWDESTLDRVSPVQSWVFTLHCNTQYTFQTSSLQPDGSCRPDTVLHIVRNNTGEWIASNDDCHPATSASCKTIAVQCGGFIDVRVFVHAYETCARSIGHFSAQGPNLSFSTARPVTFGGQVIAGARWTVDDRFAAIRPPNGVGGPATVILGGYSPGADPETFGWGRGGFYNGGTVVNPLAGSPPPTHYTPIIVVGGTATPDCERAARLYRNDIQGVWAGISDPDGDGLGAQLEAALGTCPGGAAACATGHGNPRDTDGDGLSDFDEVMGTSRNHLPFWGADPLHYDAFLEVDVFGGGSPMTGLMALGVAALYSDGDVGNPNGSPGIRLHVDTGTSSCVNGTCSTTWGDWGGFSSIPGQNNADHTSLAISEMGSWRRGYFRYAVSDNGSPGGTASRWSFRYRSNSERTVAHELGHTFALDHGGDQGFNCKPNYPSLMNYAYGGVADVTFSDGNLATQSTDSLCEGTGIGDGTSSILEAGFGFPRDASDPFERRVDWNRDGDFDDCPVAAPGRWDTARTPAVCIGNEDWGQDTPAFAGAANEAFKGGDPIAVAALSSSELFVLHRAFAEPPGAAGPFVSPLVLGTFQGGLDRCAGGQTEGCCQGDGDRYDDCGTWTLGIPTPELAAASAPAAARVDWDLDDGLGSPRIAYVYTRVGAGGELRMALNSVARVGGSLTFGQPLEIGVVVPPEAERVDGGVDANGGPVTLSPSSVHSLLPLGGDLLVLYRTADDKLYQVRLDGQLVIQHQGPVMDGASIAESEFAAPLARHPFTHSVYAVVTGRAESPDQNQQFRLGLFTRGGADTWARVPEGMAFEMPLQSIAPPSLGAQAGADPPSLALTFVPDRTWSGAGFGPQNEDIKRTWLSWMDGNRTFRYANATGPRWQRYYAGGTHLVSWLSPSGGHRLSSVALRHVSNQLTPDGRITFWPFASGISPAVLGDSDDWERMHAYGCDRLHDMPAGVGGADPAICTPNHAIPISGPLEIVEEFRCPPMED